MGFDGARNRARSQKVVKVVKVVSLKVAKNQPHIVVGLIVVKVV